jgi:hypothetical protein
MKLNLPELRKTLTMRQMVPEGDGVPDWYGVAYADPMTGNAICYPMPLHFIYRWARLAYYAFMLPRPAWWEKRFREMRKQGYKDGFTHAQAYAEFAKQSELDKSYNDGWNAALAKIEELADAKFGEGKAGSVEP